jgi:exodeoxyribonuclease VII small subunit
MANKDNEPTFRELSDQLDAVLLQLQADDVDVGEALKLHQQGTKLLEQLEKRLTSAEHQVTTIKTKRS